MSAPDTNLEKQARRHSPSLYGIALALIAAALAAFFFVAWDGVADDEQAAPATVTETN